MDAVEATRLATTCFRKFMVKIIAIKQTKADINLFEPELARIDEMHQRSKALEASSFSPGLLRKNSCPSNSKSVDKKQHEHSRN